MSKLDLFGDLRKAIIGAIPHDAKSANTVAELNARPLDDLLTMYLNWRDRLIHPHPRIVHRSANLIFRWIPGKQQVDLEKLTEKIALGADLTPHLSRGIVNGFAPNNPASSGKNLGRRRDLDLLLNEWGIHHVHLSDRVEPSGFTERHNLVLFGIFDINDAYLIDVMSHGNWSNQHLVEVAVRNWPTANLFRALTGVIGLSETVSPSDREQLRRAGVTTLIQVDGAVYVSRKLGISTAGTSVAASTEAHRVLRSLQSITDGLQCDPEYLRKYVEMAGKTHVAEPSYKLILLRTSMYDGFGILEEKTGAIIGI